MTISVTRKDIFGTMEELKQVLKGISLSYDFWVIKPHVFGFQLNALKFDLLVCAVFRKTNVTIVTIK